MSYQLLTIAARSGGAESEDWARMLLRMYTRWAERSGVDYWMVSETPGEHLPSGLASASISFRGAPSLAGEAGIHSLKRISPHDPEGRRHTSFATVSTGSSGTLRTYVLDPYRLVTGSSPGQTSDQVEAILDGDLSLFLPPPEAIPRATIRDFVLAAGCSCWDLGAADYRRSGKEFKGVAEEQEDPSGIEGSLWQIVEHDPRCPHGLAERLGELLGK